MLEKTKFYILLQTQHRIELFQFNRTNLNI